MRVAAKQFVLDASVTVAWCFDDESTPFTEAILDLLSGEQKGLHRVFGRSRSRMPC